MGLLKRWEEQIRVLVEPKDIKTLKKSDLNCVVVVAETKKELLSLSKGKILDWQLQQVKSSDSHCYCFKNSELQILLLQLKDIAKASDGTLKDTARTYVRNQAGAALSGKCCVVEVVLNESGEFAQDIVSGLTEAMTLGAYSFKNNKKTKFRVYFPKSLVSVSKEAYAGADATNFSRYLIDLPPNELNPKTYVKLLQDLTKGKKDFKITVKSKELESEGYGLVHAVGKGAEHPPALVRVEYSKTSKASKTKSSSATKSKKPKMAFVGKGITFDTGGLDLKPSNFMRWMKKDMGGSAAVAGLLYNHVNATHKNLDEVDYYFAIAENAVGEKAFRPGDIYTAGNGLSVEIHNTDAEGRLALADALSWLSKDKNPPEIVIDIATLTGAIKAGLGAYVGGLFSNDFKLSQDIFAAAWASGDHLWPMPTPYWTEGEIKKTPVADLVNATDGYGGAITATQFLKQFVPPTSQWAHLDIYAWVDSAKGPFKQKGGSGQAVLAIIEWLRTY